MSRDAAVGAGGHDARTVRPPGKVERHRLEPCVAHHAADGRLPEPYAAILGGGRDHRQAVAAGTHRDGMYRAGVLVETANHRAGLQVPDAQGQIDAAADKRPAVVEQAQGGDPARMCAERPDRRSGREIPEQDAAIQAGRQHRGLVEPDDRHDRVALLRNGADRRTVGPCEQFDDAALRRMSPGHRQDGRRLARTPGPAGCAPRRQSPGAR